MKAFAIFTVLLLTSAPAFSRNLKADPITDAELLALSKDLHVADVNGVIVQLNLQGQTTAGNFEDLAPGPLVVSDPSASFTIPTYASALALFDEYQKNVTIADVMTPELLALEAAFIDAVMGTQVIQMVHQFLAGKGYVTTDVAEYKALLTQIWFGRWAEATPGVLSSSGWEHYALGERLPDNTLVGFHNWVYFYDEEGEADGDYRGYIDITRTSTTTILSMPVFLYNSTKASTEFEFGASPELDIAIGTLCFFARPNAPCPVAGADDTPYTYDVHTVDYNGVTYLESSHPTFE